MMVKDVNNHLNFRRNKMEEFTFNEKITNLKTIHWESGQLMTTISTLDEFPATFQIGADMDLFNIKPNNRYQIRVKVSNDKTIADPILVHVSNAYIPRERFTTFDGDYGIANGSFVFSITTEFAGNYRISFELYDNENNRRLDSLEQFIHVSKRQTKMEQESQFEVKPNNVIQMKSEATSNRGIMKPEETEDKDMSQNTYTKAEIDAKFDKVNTEIQYGFKAVDLKLESMEKTIDAKFSNIEKNIENMFLNYNNKQLDQQAKDRKELTYWAIGILVALAGIAIPIWLGK